MTFKLTKQLDVGVPQGVVEAWLASAVSVHCRKEWVWIIQGKVKKNQSCSNQDQIKISLRVYAMYVSLCCHVWRVSPLPAQHCTVYWQEVLWHKIVDSRKHACTDIVLFYKNYLKLKCSLLQEQILNSRPKNNSNQKQSPKLKTTT